MAPVCAACHLSMGNVCVFVICFLLLTLKVNSLIVYDRQTLLDLCVFTKNLAKCTAVSDKSTMLPKSLCLFAGSRIYFAGVFVTTAVVNMMVTWLRSRPRRFVYLQLHGLSLKRLLILCISALDCFWWHLIGIYYQPRWSCPSPPSLLPTSMVVWSELMESADAELGFPRS